MAEHKWGTDPEFVGPLHMYRERLMMRAVRRYFKGGTILDAGMGGGSLLLQLARLPGATVDGIDRSTEFVAQVRHKARAQGLGNVSVKQGVLGKLPYPKGSFDLITCGEVIEHIDDKPAVKEFSKVLKRGGILILTTPNDPGQWSHTDEWAGHKRRYTKETMLALLNPYFDIESFHYLGFPIIRLYQRLVFRRLVAGKLKNPQATKPSPLKNLLSWMLSILFHLDELCSWHPGGVGMIVVAKKR